MFEHEKDCKKRIGIFNGMIVLFCNVSYKLIILYIIERYYLSRAVNGSDQWIILRYFYQYFLARTIKLIVQRHRHVLLSDEVIARHNLDVNSIFSAMSLVRFDEVYTR